MCRALFLQLLEGICDFYNPLTNLHIIYIYCDPLKKLMLYFQNFDETWGSPHPQFFDKIHFFLYDPLMKLKLHLHFEIRVFSATFWWNYQFFIRTIVEISVVYLSKFTIFFMSKFCMDDKFFLNFRYWMP